jgi:hypothetical protein
MTGRIHSRQFHAAAGAELRLAEPAEPCEWLQSA